MTEAVSGKGETDEALRKRFGAWLQRYYPAEWRHKLAFRLRGDQERKWLRLLYEHGWRAPGWPTEHGGMGLTFRQQLIYHEELEKFGAARFIDFGGALLGPTLILYGSDEQRARYLPDILSGVALWCQGYSEPNAGSDLASLRLAARRDGKEFVLSGSKIWTTHAADADYMFLLARTAKTESPRDGISFFVLDMRTAGLSIRPITNLAGEDEFAQVFFDDVRVPGENLIHELNQGWQVARSLLGIERIINGSPYLSRKALSLLDKLTQWTGQHQSVTLLQARARLECDLLNAEALYAEICEQAVAGTVQQNMLSMMKVIASELFQKVMNVTMSFSHQLAGQKEAVRIQGELIQLHQTYMISRPSSIYSGANEIQRDIIARGLLGP